MSVPDQETSYFYTGNGVTTTFAYGFYLLALADIKVSLNGVEQTTGFTVNGVGSQTGGAVIFAIAPADGISVLIERNVAIKRDTDYQPNGDLRSGVLNNDFDRIWMALQDKKRENVRSLRYPTFENLDGLLPNAASRANMVLGFSANGLHTMLPIPASVGAGNLITDVFTSGAHFTPGVTTALTLSRDPGTKDNALIFFDGVFQGPDQFGLSGATLTFNAPIPVGVTTVFVRIGTTLSISTPPSKSVGDSELQWGDVLSRVVSSIADLKNLAKITYTRAFVLGYYTKGDGGGGAYWLDPSDTTSADNGGTIIVAEDGARWKYLNNQAIYAETFGAKGDGVTNDATAIKAGVAWLASLFGGDLLFRSKVYAIGQTIKISTSSVGLIGEGNESNITGNFGTTFKWIGGNEPVVWFDLVDSPRLKDISINCANLASAGIRAQGVRFGQFENFAVRDFTSVGFYGLTGTVAGEWSSGNLVQNFIITSANNGVDGLLLDGDAAANNDWWGNTFQNGLIQVSRTATESHAGHLVFCDSNTFTEVDFTVAAGGAGTAQGLLFDAATRTLFPQNNNFYGCSIFSAFANEPGANVISKNYLFLFPTKDGETIPTHPKLIGMTDEGAHFGDVLELKRSNGRIRLSPNTANRSYDILLNANDAADAGIQIIRRVAGVDTVIFQIDQNGQTYVNISGLGLKGVTAGAADSGGIGFRALVIPN